MAKDGLRRTKSDRGLVMPCSCEWARVRPGGRGTSACRPHRMLPLGSALIAAATDDIAALTVGKLGEVGGCHGVEIETELA